MNAIIRQLQIALITDTPNTIVDWFKKLWNRLTVLEINVYHKNGGEFIYYLTDGDSIEVVFYQDDQNNKFFCNYTIYWSYLESILNLNSIGDYKNSQVITKILLETYLGNIPSTPQGVMLGDNVKLNRLKILIDESNNQTITD